MRLKAIGTIYTPYSDLEDMPIQPASALGVNGKVVIEQEFGEGLKDLDGFSHIILIYYLHLSSDYNLTVKPFLDDKPRGLFATRAPRRPNPIGLSVLRLEKIEGLTLHVSNVDIVDGTPLLDIKPFVPRFDCPPNVSIGWLSDKLDDIGVTKSDDRFSGSLLSKKDS